MKDCNEEISDANLTDLLCRAVHVACRLPSSRENSLVRTKITEAALWHRFGIEASAPAKGGEADRQAEGHDAVGTGEAEAQLIDELKED